MDYDSVVFSGDFHVNLKPGTSTKQVAGYKVRGNSVEIENSSLFLTDFGVVVLTRDRQPFGWGYHSVVSVVSSDGGILYI